MSPMGKCRMGKCRYGYMSHGYMSPIQFQLVALWSTKLDQGALGMSDPLGPLQLALKPNSASSINRPLLNFYYCAHWSLIMGNTEAWKQLNWYSTNSDLTVPAEVICQDSGGYMPTRRRRLYAKTVEVICQLPIDTLRTQTDSDRKKECEECQELWNRTIQRSIGQFSFKSAWWTKNRWSNTWRHWSDLWEGDQLPRVPVCKEERGLGLLRLRLWPRPLVTKMWGEESKADTPLKVWTKSWLLYCNINLG